MGTGQGRSEPPRATVSVDAVEELIRSLAGVESARIALDEWGAVREIHVLADGSRPAKAIVRDIESGLRARWGLVVDHRRISVAQLGEAPRYPRSDRLRLRQFVVTMDPVRGRLEVMVSLAAEQPRDLFGRPLPGESSGQIWQGRAAGNASGGMGLRLAAEATLQALNQSLLPQHSFHLADIGRFAIGLQEVVVCVLDYRAPRGGGDAVAGAALVRTEALEAAVRAVLDGSNRLYGLAARRPLQFASPGEVYSVAPDWPAGSAVSAAPAPSSAEGEPQGLPGGGAQAESGAAGPGQP